MKPSLRLCTNYEFVLLDYFSMDSICLNSPAEKANNTWSLNAHTNVQYSYSPSSGTQHYHYRNGAAKRLGGEKNSNSRRNNRWRQNSATQRTTSETSEGARGNSRQINYNFANSPVAVSIPKYHYDGGPKQIKNLLATCWRLHYLKCRRPELQPYGRGGGGGGEDNSLTPTLSTYNDAAAAGGGEGNSHPCCKLVSRPGPKTALASNRISRWLH